MLVLLVVACLGAVAYSYVLYPLLLPCVAAVATRLRGNRGRGPAPQRDTAAADAWPDVAVVISAYNEERHIEARVDNLLRLDYPPDRLRILIGSDGSRDRTGAILASMRHAQLDAHVFE